MRQALTLSFLIFLSSMLARAQGFDDCELAFLPSPKAVQRAQILEQRAEEEKGRSQVREIILNDLRAVNAVPLRVRVAAVDAPAEPSDHALTGIPDLENPSLILLEPLQESRTVLHEIRTARDYAQYVKDQNRGAFVFVGDFNHRSVPVFDGVVIDPRTGSPIVDISLKYASYKMTRIELETVRESLAGRLDFAFTFRTMLPPIDFFIKTLGLSNKPLGPKTLTASQYKDWVKHVGTLVNLFGISLASPDSSGLDRELRTVLDMRDSGYPYEFFLQPEVSSAIQQVVDETAIPNLSLTLLWDSTRVIEFARK